MSLTFTASAIARVLIPFARSFATQPRRLCRRTHALELPREVVGPHVGVTLSEFGLQDAVGVLAVPVQLVPYGTNFLTRLLPARLPLGASRASTSTTAGKTLHPQTPAEASHAAQALTGPPLV
jgi:hypothetical protein